MYIYQKSDGQLYASNDYLSYENREHETGFDWLVGKANNKDEAWKLLKPKTKKKKDTMNGLEKECVKKFIEENWEE